MIVTETARNIVTEALLTAVRQQNPHADHIHEPHNHELHSMTNKTANAHSSHPYCESVSCRQGWKSGFAAVLFVEGLLFGYVALILRKTHCMSTRTFRRIMHYINAGGGGIFLATGLLHILPEAVELFNGEVHGPHEHGHKAEFPVPYTIALITFFVFLFFDRVIWVDGHAHGGGRKTVPLEQYKEERKREDDDYVEFNGTIESVTTLTSEGRISDSQPLNGFTSAAFAGAGFTTLGLGSHALLESIALGSAPRFSTALNTFIAISAHRWATAMALGSRFAKSDLTTGAYSALILLFSIVSPLGVFVGFGVEGLSHIVLGIVFAISGGTFLYIGFFETLAHEFVAHPKHLVGKFLVMIGGAFLMVLVTGLLVVADVH